MRISAIVLLLKTVVDTAHLNIGDSILLLLTNLSRSWHPC